MNVIRMDVGAPVKGAAANAEAELTLVAAAPAAERARQLMAQAKAVSLEHIEALKTSLAQTQALADAVVQGGDLYAPGLHDFSRRLAEDLLWRARTLEALAERQRDAARAH
jgi:hypothetical protein